MVRKTVIAALALVSVAVIAAPVKKARSNPNAALIAEAKRDVADRMIDPSSAQFRDISVRLNGRMVCGEVNAKNSYGGYVGFKRFLYFDGDAMLMDDEGYGEIAINCYTGKPLPTAP